MSHFVIGVDIAKHWIDVFNPHTRQACRVKTTPKALQGFARKLPDDTLVIMEASGGYEQPLIQALIRENQAYTCVNPRQAREFARATGRLAKTDRVDARVLAEMGDALKLTPDTPVEPERAELAALTARRNDLVAERVREKNRQQQARSDYVRNDIQVVINMLTRRIDLIETKITEHIKAYENLMTDKACLMTMPGIGDNIAAQLIAHLPELGKVNRRAIAALAGLAPHACDSGSYRGKRRCWGGRTQVRRALYQAAFIASRYDPALKAYRQHLIDKGKPFKVAIIAVARRMLTQINAIMKTKRKYQPEANI